MFSVKERGHVRADVRIWMVALRGDFNSFHYPDSAHLTKPEETASIQILA